MKSRITIEVDFDNGNEPTIVLNLHRSDDVRDKLLDSFINKFAHQRSWCKAFYMGENQNGKYYHITPIEPKNFGEEASLMHAVGTEYAMPVKSQPVKMAIGKPDCPRRNFIPEWSSQEIGISNLIQDIEKLGAHPLLTDVVILLEQAKEKLADWIESETKI